MSSLLDLVAAQPMRAYDKSSLEQFVIAAEHERDRLQEALDRANRRREAAERRIADTTDARARLSTMVEETRRLVSRLRHDNERAVAAILDAAEAEARALVAAARADVRSPAEHTPEPQPQSKAGLTVLPAV